jgi:hypothetical protein
VSVADRRAAKRTGPHLAMAALYGVVALSGPRAFDALRARLHLFERGGERPVQKVGPGLHFAVVFILKTLERVARALMFGSVPHGRTARITPSTLAAGTSAASISCAAALNICAGFGRFHFTVL